MSGASKPPRVARGHPPAAVVFPSLAMVALGGALAAASCAERAPLDAPRQQADCRRPRVLFEPGVAGAFRAVAERMADVLNCGSERDLASLSDAPADLARFWQAYGARGEIDLRAWPASVAGRFIFCDARFGMRCCLADLRGERWVLGSCEFNDGY